MTTILETARDYVRAGLSVIPVLADGSKKPALRSWKEYQQRLPTDAELVQWFGNARVGIAIICGKVSGGLEVLDFDSASVWEEWSARVEREQPGLLERLPRVRTPSGGMHVYYRLDGRVPGNMKLARDGRGETLIETRGEGGYVLAPGCPAACHPSGKTYVPEPGLALADVPRLDGERR